MITSNEQLQVAAIKNGTVIDHISGGSALKIIRLLNLPKDKTQVTVGLNLPSKQMGVKDLIKVENRTLTPDEANRVALFAPSASINIIEKYRIVKKFTVAMPKQIHGIVVCPGAKCITNHEPMESRFKVETMNGAVSLRCDYCDTVFLRDDVKEYRV